MRFVLPWISLVLVLCAGCNGAQTPVKGPNAGRIAPSEPWKLEPLSAEDRDVSPVKPPGELVLHVRWKNPEATAKAASALAQLPGSLLSDNLRQIVRELARSELGDKVHAEVFADYVSVSAPVDLILVADMTQGGQIPDVLFAWSVGLTNIEGSLGASRGQPRRVRPGVWEVGTADKWGAPCAVATGAGRAPARLVCGENRRHVARLAAFMARNVAAQPDPPHDFRIAVGMRGLFDKYGAEWASQARGLPIFMEDLKIGNAKFDAAIMDVADALAIEAGDLMQDLDSVVLDVGLDAKQGVTLSAEATFADQRSWLVQTLIDGADKAGPAPEIVWRVPKSSHWVGWGLLGDPARYDALFKIGRELADGFMEHEKLLPDADRQALVKLLRGVQKGKHVPMVLAAGHHGKSSAGPTSILDVLSGVIGWYVVGVDESPAALKAWLEEAVLVYNRPTIQTGLRYQLGSDAKHLPKVGKVTAPKALGKDALAIEIAIPELEDPIAMAHQGGFAKPVELKAHLWLMGDGARTWLGFALDDKELTTVMAGLKAIGPESLAARTDLERMKSETHASGAFTSLSGIVASVEPIVMALASVPGISMPGLATDLLAMFEQMPNQGQTPVFMFTDVEAGAKPRLHWSANVPRGTVDDIAFVILRALRLNFSP